MPDSPEHDGHGHCRPLSDSSTGTDDPQRLARRAVPVYNAVHRLTVPLVVALVAAAIGAPALLVVAVAWCSHIVWDRGLGYPLRAADGSIRPARPER